MGITRTKILKDLKIQKEIEGETPDTKLLEQYLSMITTTREWDAMTVARFCRYGKMSYECHRFWYPSDLLKRLIGEHHG